METPALGRNCENVVVQALKARYRQSMAESKNLDFNRPSSIQDEEDEATLAAIDRGSRAAEEGRVVSSEEVRQRVQAWLTKSSTQKTR